MNAARRFTLTALGSLCALTIGLLLSSTAAQAAATHDYLFGFSEIPAGPEAPYPGAIVGNGFMTVNSGHLWSTEYITGQRLKGQRAEAAVVNEFDATNGQFIRQWPLSATTISGEGVAVGAGKVYVAQAQEAGFTVGVFGETGTPLATWTGEHTPGGSFGKGGEYIGVAVDNSTSLSDWAKGDVFVSDTPHKVVDVFQPEASGKEPAKVVAKLEGASPSEPFDFTTGDQLQRIAIDDATGDLIVLDKSNIDLFEPTLLDEYRLVGKIASPNPAIGLEPKQVDANDSAGDIYVLARVEENGQKMGEQVFEFSASGAYLGRVSAATAPGGTFGPEGDHPSSVAADPSSPPGVFVGTYAEGRPPVGTFAFGPDVVVPDVTTAPVSGVRPTGGGSIEVTLNGAVNPDGAGPASCQFDWGTSSSFGEVAACPAPVAEGASAVPVSKTFGGLSPDTTYSYRLQATNANGTNLGESWQDESFLTPGPGLHGEGVAAVRSDSVTFQAKLDPNEAPTSYYFQYGMSAAYGADAPALNGGVGASVGAGKSDVEVTQHVQALQANTIYHYRLVVVSELAPGQLEAFYGPDRTFTTQSQGVPLRLPDGRAWEMVSPPLKEGARLTSPAKEGAQASASGDAVADETYFQPIEAEPEGSDNLDEVFFGRGVNGWAAKMITPPHAVATDASVGAGFEYRVFSEDLSTAAVEPFGGFLALSPEATEATAYLRTTYLNGDASQLCASGCYRPLVSAANVPSGAAFGEEQANGKCAGKLTCGPEFVAGTPDLGHLLIDSRVGLTDTPEDHGGLYEWSAGKLALVQVLPPGETNEKGGSVAANAEAAGDRRHTISNDGSRVIWQGSPRVLGAPRLYLRDMRLGETVRLDVPQAGASEASAGGAEYMTASSDGSRIFFLDSGLTADSTPHSTDLYEYNVNAPIGSRLTDLSVDRNGGEKADVKMVLGASEDGSYVYFAAVGALAPGATSTCPRTEFTKTERPCNLYVSHEGRLTFIASLSDVDSVDSSPALSSLPVRVSPDGRWLAFMSNRELTGDDTIDAVSGHPDEEVYLYDALRGRLVCASCNPSGARPVGLQDRGVAEGEEPVALEDLGLPDGAWVASSVPGWVPEGSLYSLYQSRYLSDSGRLFFDSNDAISPQDVNGTEDVYEYEPVGVGDCSVDNVTYSSRSEGCVDLVSSGTSSEESTFFDASASGGDVFFLTTARLVPADFDNAPDIYDAHECTVASPCIAPAPAAPPPCDNADSCKPAQSLQPTMFGAGPSETFSGAGNITPATPVAVARGLTRAQKLVRALTACGRVKGARRRVACRRRARRLYGGGAASKAARHAREAGRERPAGHRR